MKHIYSALLFTLISTLSYSQTFDWETATDTGSGITQTVSGVTATFTSSYSNDDSKLVNGGGFSGSSGFLVYTYQTDSGDSATVTFSSPVDITSIYALSAYSFSGTRTWTFTPSGGSNSITNQDITYGTGSTVTVNWTNVNSFTITSSVGDDSFGLDNIVFSTSTLSTSDFSINDKVVYPNPSSSFIHIKGLTEISNYSIFNNLGAEVMNGTLLNTSKIDIQNLNNGIYFLKTDNGNTFKFIKD
jgi:hypothetical protein